MFDLGAMPLASFCFCRDVQLFQPSRAFIKDQERELKHQHILQAEMVAIAARSTVLDSDQDSFYSPKHEVSICQYTDIHICIS